MDSKRLLVVLFVTAILLGIAVAGCDRDKDDDTINGPGDTTGSDPFVMLERIDLNVPEPSDLALDPSGQFLWTVSDQTGRIYKLDLQGNVIREIEWTGDDLEGVTVSTLNGHLFVTEEGLMEVVELDTSGNEISSFEVNNVQQDNDSGLEGIAYDSQNDRLIVLNEKMPSMVLLIGLDGRIQSQHELFVDTDGDIAGVCYDATLDYYWIVSDEEKMLMVFDRDFNLIHSRVFNLTKLEGIAVSDDYIYMVSDSNEKMYVFPKEHFFPAEE